MLLSHASDKMAADRSGNLLEVNESTAPTADGASGHLTAGSDLGGIEHLFRDPFIASLHTASTALTQATGSTPGPHGGSVPAYLQHNVEALKADGEELLQGSLHGVGQVAGQRPQGIVTAIQSQLYRLRIALGL